MRGMEILLHPQSIGKNDHDKALCKYVNLKEKIMFDYPVNLHKNLLHDKLAGY